MSHDTAVRSMTPAPELVEIPWSHRNVHSSSGGESGLDRYCRDSLDPMPAVGFRPQSVLGNGEGSLLERGQTSGVGMAAPTLGSRSFVDLADQTLGSTPMGTWQKPPVGY